MVVDFINLSFKIRPRDDFHLELFYSVVGIGRVVSVLLNSSLKE